MAQRQEEKRKGGAEKSARERKRERGRGRERDRDRDRDRDTESPWNVRLADAKPDERREEGSSQPAGREIGYKLIA